ncbi:hypothetical protein CBS101457_003579 [Exobasidium rhododendri]|nr:hypothetical protein CBS101457_003579 [Exobasidium rhododendri]
MTETHAKALHKAAIEACSMPYRAADYNEFYTKIVKAVEMVGLEIRRTVDECKGTKLVGLVNAKGDAISQMATTFSPHEITLVKIMIEKIITAPYNAYCIGSKEALELAGKLDPPIAPTKAERVCDRMVRCGWFRLTRLGRYSLTPRSLMELQGYLTSTFDDYVSNCVDCKELLTEGSACSHSRCDVRVHRHCLLRWERSLQANRDDEKICSQCLNVWIQTPVGEAVLLSTNEDIRSARGKGARRRQRAAAGSQADAEDAENDMAEEEEEEEEEGEEEEEEEE